MKTLSKKLLFTLILMPFLVLSQGTISGVVKDGATGQPLPGVNVVVKGTQNGASTDFDGKYSLSKLKSGDVIEFSFIGYKTQDVTYTNQKNLDVSLTEETSALDEITILAVGYGTVKKKDATGSVSLVTAKDFNKGAVVTADNLLNGKVAGVTINAGGGAPGAVPVIRIRGGSSLSANNDPLVVVDGLPMNVEVLNRINPNDIESFSILKDASAAAIYGNRAANGVIMITTKRGGKALAVEYNFQYGSGTNFNKVPVLSANQFRDFIIENQNLLSTTPATSILPQLGNANTDWQDAIYRRTDLVDQSLSVRGNLFNRVPTRVTIGNTYQEGLRLTDYMNRNMIGLSMNPSFFNDHLKVRLNANYSNTSRRNAPGVEGSALLMNPTQPIYDPNSPFDGFYESMTPNTDPTNINNFAPIAIPNPVAQLLQTFNTSRNNKVFGNFEVDYKFHFLPELRWVTNLGYDRDWGFGINRISTTARTSPIRLNQFIGNNTFSDGFSQNKNLDTYFVYSNEFNKLRYDITAGYNYQRFDSESFTTFNQNNPDLSPLFSPREPLIFVSFFSRANFSYNDKYLLTLTMRREGTSRFGENNRWGNFPAASFAWKLKEDLFSNIESLSELKLRAGWGVAGQQDIFGSTNSLIYLAQYLQGDQFSQYNFGGTYLNPSLPQGYNPLIKWEETTTYNLGLDFGFNNNRLNGSIEGYYKLSKDLIQIAPFADGSNFTNVGAQNIGDMDVKGVELNLNYDVIRNDQINWNVNFNANKFERRIRKMANGDNQLVGGIGIGVESQVHSVGFTPNSFFVFKQLYDPSGSPIEGAFADLNGDGVVNESDRYIYFNPDPDLILGFSTSFSYKNFDLGFNLRASVGNRILNVIKARNSFITNAVNGVLQNVHSNTLETEFLSASSGGILSDMFVENASFLRMDYATLGYTFQNWLDGKAKLRIYTGVQNPFIWTKYSGLDPEINGGNDQTIYPRQRQFLFGANVNF